MNPNRKPMMAGNWKMHKTGAEAASFVQALASQLKSLPANDLPDIIICPPYTALPKTEQTLKETGIPVGLGSQNMAAHESGAYTGEVAPGMLAEFGVEYVILGHSERREYYNETDEAVNAKTALALSKNLIPIVCVGESLAQREAGETDSWVRGQVEAALKGFDTAQRRQIVLAYEPIWAIGTGKVCDATEANRVIGLIRQAVGVAETRILYGGSMKPDNVEGLMAQPEIDGGLVGGASLEADSFFKLIQAAMPVRV